MLRRKKKKDDVNANGWLDTYADTITLLLTFFILLYSMSAVDSQKLNELSEALKKSLGGSSLVSELKEIEELTVTMNKADDVIDESEDLVKQLNQVIEKNALAEVVKIREEERGIILQLDETILFDPGKADLKSYSQNVLETITTIVNDLDNDILIEGNTDNIPMNNEDFASNWELSTARAVSVVRYFVETKELDPARFAVKGYGEFKPLVENDSVENRKINRRVDILIVDEEKK